MADVDEPFAGGTIRYATNNRRPSSAYSVDSEPIVVPLISSDQMQMVPNPSDPNHPYMVYTAGGGDDNNNEEEDEYDMDDTSTSSLNRMPTSSSQHSTPSSSYTAKPPRPLPKRTVTQPPAYIKKKLVQQDEGRVVPSGVVKWSDYQFEAMLKGLENIRNEVRDSTSYPRCSAYLNCCSALAIVFLAVMLAVVFFNVNEIVVKVQPYAADTVASMNRLLTDMNDKNSTDWMITTLQTISLSLTSITDIMNGGWFKMSWPLPSMPALYPSPAAPHDP